MLTRYREERKSLRRFTRRSATVAFGAGKPSVDCVIWDMSDGGARLAVAHPLADLPHYFTLDVVKDGSVKRHCEVVWTDTRFVGVKFTGPAP
ncbi:MAG TPA: PilZ domain-containing protein [Xanthobacteraceae bacterium]